ncbi:dual specificity protein phosphatase 19 isoform X2 [Rhinolophus sinicus]|uniref:dual specificity protein phosphatase 19 isoform X2 n=1 Tax=Rhinolophus sinicus TaxID=89399 RepID=UPI003D7B36D5
MHSLNQEIKAFSRNNLRKQCTRVTTLTGKKIIETWKDARIHVVEEVEPSTGGGCGYVQDLSLDLQVGVIKPWLLLGSQDAAHDLDTLKKHKVTHILNVAYGVENAFLSDFIYKSISILDLPETNILSYFPECFEFIEQAKVKLQEAEPTIPCGTRRVEPAHVGIEPAAFGVKRMELQPPEPPGQPLIYLFLRLISHLPISS